MALNLTRFFKASNPTKTLDQSKEEDRQYYIDFSSVRGTNIINDLERTITRLSPDNPTCQLFTGHIGCGKSTELLRLKKDLQAQNFHVVYFESSQDLVMADVDITDILLAIAHQVSENLEQANVRLSPTGFLGLLQGAADLLTKGLTIEGEVSVPGLGDISASTDGVSLSTGIGKVMAKTKNSPELRSLIRQYLEPRTDTLLEMINQELFEPAIKELKQKGKQGLVVIIDNLDRVDNRMKPTGITQPEYLFVERGEQLKQLHCHLVYTIPLVLTFSNVLGRLKNRFGVSPKLLPMVRSRSRDGKDDELGMNLLRQMILARAFPDAPPEQRLTMISEVFDDIETLDRLCRVSGGHVRNLMVLLYSCIQKEDPPLSRNCVEDVIRRERDSLVRTVDAEEWQLLKRVQERRNVIGEEEHQRLVRSMFVFEYQDEQGGWFSLNPILAEAQQLQS